MSNFTAEEARRRREYDSDTGILRWKTRVVEKALEDARKPRPVWGTDYTKGEG
jgi:hypothetical protein